MTTKSNYLMESNDEASRLVMKTDRERLERQARWAGIAPGMRVADIGCGPGKTTALLHELVQPGGRSLGLDGSAERIAYARDHYATGEIEFECRDIYASLDDLGPFDFIWSRFFLEYHRSRSFEIVQKLDKLLAPGGILCLIDLDYNCLSHFGMPARLEQTLAEVMGLLEQNADFDPYLGRKLYSFLYDLGYQEIDVDLAAHHLIFGELQPTDAFNWAKKLEVAAQDSGHSFAAYPEGYAEFSAEFERFFSDPRRFTYTPIISCRGRKPQP